MDDRQIDELLTSALGRASGSPDAADLARTDCLDASTLAAWTSGTLDPADSDRVDQHLATCARCQEMAAIFARTEPVHTVLALKRPSPLRWIGPIAALAAAATLVWAVWLKPHPASVPAPVTTIAQTDAPAASPTPENKVAPVGQAAPAQAAPGETQSERARQQPPRQQARRDAQTGPRSTVGGVSAEPSRPAPVPATAAPLSAPIPAPAPAAPPPPPPPQPQPTFRAAAPPTPTLPPPPAAGRQMQEQVMVVDSLAASKAQAVIAEFSSAAVEADVAAVPRAAGGAGGGGGRGGGRGGAGAGTGAGTAVSVTASASPPVRWRILGSGAVERSTDAGSTWSAVTIDPPAQLTAGVAPSPNVCWLVGKGGVVLRSINGQRFERVTFPVDADLASIRATSGQLTVTTTDGRTFTTTDDGKTWR